MAMLRSSFGALEDLQRRVGLVGSHEFRVGLARRLAGAATKLLADEFRDSKDPYGRPWKPVQRNRARDVRARRRLAAAGRPPRGDKPLVDTGRLRAAATASQLTQGTTVRVSIPVEYASYHQYGTRRIPQRQIVPMAETGGLGLIWTAAWKREIELAIRQAMGRPG